MTAAHTVLGAIAFGGLGPELYGLVAAMVFLGTIAGIGLLAPDDAALLAAGTAASGGHVKLVFVLAIAWTAGVLGDAVGFTLGRRWGSTRHAARLEQMKVANSRWGAVALVFGRFLGPVRAFGPIVAGASRMPRCRFAAMSIAGAGLWAAGITLAGYGFARSLGSSLDVVGYAVLALTAVAFLVWALKRRPGSFRRAAPERGWHRQMLYGRDVELGTLEELLAGARRSRSGVLVLRGEPGVGKSALLDEAVERAADMTTLRATGVQTESEVAFAALHQVVRPLLDHLDEVPAPQAAALRAALGLGPGAEPDRFLISVAVLSLLAAGAETQPLLCVIDDAQWLDEPSAQALTFAARRLEAEAVALVFAAREGDGRRFEAPGLPELRLAGLDGEAAEALLAEPAGAALSRDVRDRLVKATGGNPLALLELPAARPPRPLGRWA